PIKSGRYLGIRRYTDLSLPERIGGFSHRSPRNKSIHHHLWRFAKELLLQQHNRIFPGQLENTPESSPQLWLELGVSKPAVGPDGSHLNVHSRRRRHYLCRARHYYVMAARLA